MIDTHAHIYADDFVGDYTEMLERANEAGVKQILLPNIDIGSIEALKLLCNEQNEIKIYGMMGLHPCSVKEDFKSQLKTIKEELYSGDYIAVGEIGMDLYWDKAKQKEQEVAFLEQCEWATDLNLPIAIHSRDSTDEIIDLVYQFKGENELGGVFHCFGGTAKQAKRILDLGFYLGIGGVLTFKNSTLRDVLKTVPLDRLVLETDSPYLAPSPYRGKRNEPSYLKHIAEHLTNVYECSVEDIISATTLNTLKLFKL